MAAPCDQGREAKLFIFKTDAEVSEQVCQFVIDKANKAIKEKSIFTVGVSGGSVAKFLCNGLPEKDTDWSKWRIFFCDERHVPFDDIENTYKYYKENLMTKVTLTEDQIFPGNPDVSVEKDAEEYTEKVRRVFPGSEVPRFDLLLLGMGPDGHTCSLFPGHALLQEKKAIIAPISDSPKPPPQRITMTMPVLLNAACAVFISCGASKAEMVKRVLEGKETDPLPAARVKPTSGDLCWFLDEPAARLLAKM